MDGKILAVVSLVIGLLVGVVAGYAVFGGQGVAVKTTTVTKTTTRTQTTPVTKTTTYTYTKAIPEKYGVQLAYSEKFGLYLTDEHGMTLYFFAKDYNGMSACQGECAEKWPIFYVDNLKVAPGLDPDDFGVITRPDGQKQITYKGWPLYYFAGDKKPGDINGDGKKGVWFVAKPDYTVLVAIKPDLGAYLVDGKGMTLYVFTKDQPGTSNCYGMCAEKWPPFSPTSLVIPSVLNITDFNFIVRSDGSVQLTYKGQPLYYWVNDHQRGDTTGHGVKNVWFVASVGGGAG